MKTTLKTEITIKEICEGFVYNELEEKGVTAETMKEIGHSEKD